MKRQMQIVIDADGTTRITAVNDDPGHSVQLVPFVEALSRGDKTLAHTHVHDHGEHTHSHVHSGAHSH